MFPKSFLFLVLLFLHFLANGNNQDSDSIFSKLPKWLSVLECNVIKPAWKQNSHELLYLEKSTGKVESINVISRKKEQLKGLNAQSGYEYCLNLSNGDFLVCGNTTVKTGDFQIDDHRQEMWVLSKSLELKPVSLHEFSDRGPAIARNEMKIAWAAPGQQEIFMADLVYEKGVPSLKNKKLLLSYKDSSAIIRIETQDFRPPNNNELLFTRFTGTPKEPFSFAEVCGYNLKTGTIINYSKSPESFDEARGISPDGKFMFIESDRHFGERQWKTDIYKLLLDGSAKTERLTFFTSEFPGVVVENPVMSDDGKYIAFQVKTKDSGLKSEFCILLFDFDLYNQSINP